MPEEIRLDKKMFEVLSSDTRRKILVNLNSHPFTVSDLSRLIGMHKSAVYEHLQILMDVELVYKKESDNEFVYYDLTEKGRALINGDSSPGYKIYIMLMASIISLAGGLLGIIMFAIDVSGIPASIFSGTPAISTPIPTIIPIPTGTTFPTAFPTSLPIPTAAPVYGQYFHIDIAAVELMIGVCLILVGLILLYYSSRALKPYKFHKLSIPFIRR